jgi:TonB family protein
LDARLLPQLEDDVEREARCRSDKHQVELAGRYPRAALATGQQGSVVVRYTLMPDGSSRNPRILYAVPPGTFERTVRTAILHLHSPEDPRAAPADCSVMYRFVMAGSTFDGLKDFAKNVRVEAEAGKPAAQLTYGMLLANFPGELAVKKSDSVPWFLKAAQAGSPQAQFAVGTSLTLNGWGCHCDETKGEVWLRKAAEADHPAAQVGLATYALRGSPTEANTRLASVWLERAAKNGDQEGMFYLAALLAATPFADLRDPGRALALLEKVQGEFSNNPSLNEIRAAAQAGGGDFKAAVASEQHAIGSARVVSWNLAPLKERLARYQASQAWYGNLLAL